MLNKRKIVNFLGMVIFLNDTEHYQGGELLHVKKGDCLLFNSFNLHKRGNDIAKENEDRRVLQYFHVFLNQDEHKKFETPFSNYLLCYMLLCDLKRWFEVKILQ